MSERGMVTIPAELRRRLDIEAGDRLRWYVDDRGDLQVEVARERYGAFDDDFDGLDGITRLSTAGDPFG